MVMLGELKDAVILLGLIALVASAVAIALTEFQSSDSVTSDSFAYNASQNGLVGVDNTTSFLGVIGTIIAVVALVTIVIGAFSVGKR